MRSDLPLVVQIALVCDNNDWEILLVLYTKNLLVEDGDLIERVSRSNAVDQEEALASAHVLFSHCAERSGRKGGDAGQREILRVRGDV